MVKKTRDFTRGERQKEVTEKYRSNWNKIFKKDEKKETNQEKS